MNDIAVVIARELLATGHTEWKQFDADILTANVLQVLADSGYAVVKLDEVERLRTELDAVSRVSSARQELIDILRAEKDSAKADAKYWQAEALKQPWFGDMAMKVNFRPITPEEEAGNVW